MTNSFWFNNPSILLDNAHFTEIIPKEGNLALKLNAITRLIILITIVSFGFTRSLRVLISAGITLCSIVIIYKIKRFQVNLYHQKHDYNYLFYFLNQFGML